MNQPFKSEDSVGYLVNEVAKAFRRRFEEVAKRYELTLPQGRVLAELARQGGVSQVTLAAAVDADPMTLKGILDRLSRRGLVRRDQDPLDSRAKMVHLTEAGQSLFDSVRSVGPEIYETAIAGLSEAELKALAQGLIHIRNNLTGAGAPPKDMLK